jgi:hypothetical protein
MLSAMPSQHLQLGTTGLAQFSFFDSLASRSGIDSNQAANRASGFVKRAILNFFWSLSRGISSTVLVLKTNLRPIISCRSIVCLERRFRTSTASGLRITLEKNMERMRYPPRKTSAMLREMVTRGPLGPSSSPATTEYQTPTIPAPPSSPPKKIQRTRFAEEGA